MFIIKNRKIFSLVELTRGTKFTKIIEGGTA